MTYHTPFTVRDGIFHDRHFMPVQLSMEDVHLPMPQEAELDVARLVCQGVNTLRLYLDDAAFADADGNMVNEAALKAFDRLVEQAYRSGFYLILVPVATGKATGLDAALFTRQQRYFSTLFTRRSSISGKRLYEYDNIAAMEILFGLSTFEDQHFELYCGRGMMEVFIEHYFAHRVPKVYSLERGEPSARQRETMARHHIKIVNAEVFTKRDNRRLQCEMMQPGIPESVIRGGIRASGDLAWCPIAISDAMSITEHPHANGGAEGWLTFAADIPVDLRLSFPVPVKTATFRPSLRESLETSIDGHSVGLTLPTARYGALEINYDLPDTPAYTVYILGDRIQADPADSADASAITFVAPGRHTLDDLDYAQAGLLYFLPGLHEIEGDKIPLKSNCNVFLSRGCVVRAGVIAEEVENATLFGQGILDGSTSPRDVGENKGERMGEKWMEDAGREGFVCFFKGRDIIFDGPVIYNSNYWNIVISGTENAVVRNHKAITWLQNTDGIQPRSCNNLLVEHCFLKCADDCIAVKTRRSLGMESRHILCRDLVLWHDRVGNGLEIGHTSQADLLEDVVFRDVAAIYGGGNGNCLSTHIIDHSTVRDVLFEDIRVEGRPFCCDFGFGIQPSYYTTDDERGRIQGVTVRNYRCEARISSNSAIRGFDADHQVEDVLFEEIVEHCNDPQRGRRLGELSEFLKVCEHADGVRLK
jgi:hypothetical protein